MKSPVGNVRHETLGLEVRRRIERYKGGNADEFVRHGRSGSLADAGRHEDSGRTEIGVCSKVFGVCCAAPLLRPTGLLF